VLFASCSLANAAPDAKQPPHGSVQLISENSAVAPGEGFTLGLLFKLDPHWHTYWVNPGDSGEPARLRWQLPEGFSAGEIQWPTPKRLPTGSLMDFGYEQQVLLPVRVQAPASISAKQLAIHAAVSWLVCSDICIPAKAELDIVLATGQSKTNPQTVPLFEQTRAALPEPLPTSWKLNVEDGKDEIKLRINSGGKLRSVTFFPLDADVIENARPQHLEKSATGLTLTLQKSDQLTGPLPRLRGLLADSENHSYQFSVAIARKSGKQPEHR
jgi:thiol:disulfide interchange protein DsbD